jgi:hypothetical protein
MRECICLSTSRLADELSLQLALNSGVLHIVLQGWCRETQDVDVPLIGTLSSQVLHNCLSIGCLTIDVHCRQLNLSFHQLNTSCLKFIIFSGFLFLGSSPIRQRRRHLRVFLPEVMILAQSRLLTFRETKTDGIFWHYALRQLL